MIERIQQLLEAEGLTPPQFAERIGVQRSAISHIMSGRNKPSFDMMRRIIEAFPHVSAEWLIAGRGSMHKPDCPSPASTEPPSLFDTPAASGWAVTTVINPQGKSVEGASEAVDTNVNSHQEPPVSPPVPTATKKPVRVLLLFADGTFDSYEPI